MRLLPSALVAALALLLAPVAMADNSITPPGNSGVDQYRETLPSSSGGSTGGGHSGGSGGSALPSSTVRSLNQTGAAGRAAARNLGATAPSTSRPRGGGAVKRHGSTGSSTVPRPSGGDSTASSLLKAAATGSGAGGIGLLLPFLLAGGLLAAGMFAVVGRRLRAG